MDASPLLAATAALAQAWLAAMGTELSRQGERLVHAGGFVAVVDFGCTVAVPALVLWAALGALWMRARLPWARGLAFAVVGAGVLAIANELRLAVVLWTGVHASAQFAWVHGVAGPLWLVAVGTAVVAWAARVEAVRRSGAADEGGRTASAGVSRAPFLLRRRASATGLAWLTASIAAMGTALLARDATAIQPTRPAAWTAMATTANAASPTPPPAAPAPIRSGDVIVKFRDASEAGRHIAAVVAGQRDDVSAMPVAARVSADLGVPMVLVQVTSGREALLALDREALGRSLLARAGREAQVQRAVMSVPPPGGGLPGAELVLRLELRPAAPPGTAQAVASRMAVPRMPAPRVQAEGGKELRLVYDVDAWTLALIERLKQRSDVEYVQANRMLRAAPPAAPR